MLGEATAAGFAMLINGYIAFADNFIDHHFLMISKGVGGILFCHFKVLSAQGWAIQRFNYNMAGGCLSRGKQKICKKVFCYNLVTSDMKMRSFLNI